jgi:hypothetical protein
VLVDNLSTIFLCGGNVRRRMEIRSWKQDLRRATFLAK